MNINEYDKWKLLADCGFPLCAGEYKTLTDQEKRNAHEECLKIEAAKAQLRGVVQVAKHRFYMETK